MVPMMFTILTGPSGVAPSNGCSAVLMPSAVSCAVMYWRVLALAGEPDGRGPIASCCRRCSHALLLSKTEGVWVTRTRLTSSNRNIVPLRSAFVNLLGPSDLGVGIEQHLFPLCLPDPVPREAEPHRDKLT